MTGVRDFRDAADAAFARMSPGAADVRTVAENWQRLTSRLNETQRVALGIAIEFFWRCDEVSHLMRRKVEGGDLDSIAICEAGAFAFAQAKRLASHWQCQNDSELGKRLDDMVVFCQAAGFPIAPAWWTAKRPAKDGPYFIQRIHALATSRDRALTKETKKPTDKGAMNEVMPKAKAA